MLDFIKFCIGLTLFILAVAVTTGAIKAIINWYLLYT